jgi:putative ABC transport system permease protein
VTDLLRELVEDLVRHPLRSALTALSVAWGTFMLVVLLGLGTGLQSSVRWQFRDDATNSIWVYDGETSLAYAGHAVGRPVQFVEADIERVGALPGVEHLTGRFYPPGRQALLKVGDRASAFGVRSVHPDHVYLENTLVTAGRFLNPRDLTDKRKVVVLGREVADFLFRGQSADRVLGRWVDVAGTPFRVVGLFDDEGGEGEVSIVYIPITTARTVFRGGDRVDQIMFTVGDADIDEAKQIASVVTRQIAQSHQIHPDDPTAFRVRNYLEQFQQLQGVFVMLEAFTWVVGIGTVLAGIVGVGNIMLVSVQERTAEIGLRKALGAPPGRIVWGIVREAVLLTAVAGYSGVVAGVATVEALRLWMPPNDYLREPQAEVGVALVAMVMLTVAGAVAGFVPAWRAATVDPIVALRDGG